MNTDTLYYDGACPLCRAEIGKLARFSRGELELVDIHQLDDNETGLDKSALLSRLHLKTADGNWVIGLKANIRAWQHTPFGFLWRVLDWPLVNWFSYRAYEFWLQRRSARACPVDQA